MDVREAISEVVQAGATVVPKIKLKMMTMEDTSKHKLNIQITDQES